MIPKTTIFNPMYFKLEGWDKALLSIQLWPSSRFRGRQACLILCSALQNPTKNLRKTFTKLLTLTKIWRLSQKIWNLFGLVGIPDRLIYFCLLAFERVDNIKSFSGTMLTVQNKAASQSHLHPLLLLLLLLHLLLPMFLPSPFFVQRHLTLHWLRRTK